MNNRSMLKSPAGKLIGGITFLGVVMALISIISSVFVAAAVSYIVVTYVFPMAGIILLKTFEIYAAYLLIFIVAWWIVRR